LLGKWALFVQIDRLSKSLSLFLAGAGQPQKENPSSLQVSRGAVPVEQLSSCLTSRVVEE
jgi:hypothetical protein